MRFFERANGQFDFDGGGNQDFDEIDRSDTDGIDAIEHKAAGGGVNKVDNVVKPAAEFVDIFAVEGGDKGLVQLGEKGVGNLVAFMFDGLDDLHLFRDAGVVREHFQQGFSARMDIGCLFGEEDEETLFARQESLQKSWHGDSLLKSR